MTSEWRQVTIGELATWRGGLTPSKARSDFWVGGSIPWVSSKEVTGGVLRRTEHLITEAALQGTALRLIPPGAVAVVVRSGILLHTFPVVFVPFEVTVNQDVKIATPKAGVDGRFMALLLEAEGPVILARHRKTGTTVQSINVPALLSHPVPLPPLEVQRRIVDVVGAHDAHIANLNTEADAIETALRLQRGAFMLEGDPTRAGSVFSILMGRQRSPQRASGPHMTKYLRAANVKDGFLDLSDLLEMDFEPDERERFGLEPGDVLVSEGSGSPAAVGAAARFTGQIAPPLCFQNTLLRYRALDGVTTPSFVYHWCRWAFESGRFRECAFGTNILHIGALRAIEMPVMLPAPERQAEMCELLDSFEANVAALRQEHSRLTAVRAQLLDALLSREVEIPESYDEMLAGAA